MVCKATRYHGDAQASDATENHVSVGGPTVARVCVKVYGLMIPLKAMLIPWVWAAPWGHVGVLEP